MNLHTRIDIVNENGVHKSYSEIPDVWHLAMNLTKDKPTQDAILEVWHQAHDYRAILEKQGKAKLIGVQK